MAEKETKTLVQVIDSQAWKIQEILPEGQNSDKDAARVIRLARLAIIRNPDLMDCTPISVVESIMQASQLGLEIASPIGGAHLVPFGNAEVIAQNDDPHGIFFQVEHQAANSGREFHHFA